MNPFILIAAFVLLTALLTMAVFLLSRLLLVAYSIDKNLAVFLVTGMPVQIDAENESIRTVYHPAGSPPPSVGMWHGVNPPPPPKKVSEDRAARLREEQEFRIRNGFAPLVLDQPAGVTVDPLGEEEPREMRRYE